jgi:hypothetical protein
MTTQELTSNQTERQDFVDNAIYELIASLNPSNKKEISWNIEMIGDVRECIRHWLVERHQVCTDLAFYPFINGNS